MSNETTTTEAVDAYFNARVHGKAQTDNKEKTYGRFVLRTITSRLHSLHRQNGQRVAVFDHERGSWDVTVNTRTPMSVEPVQSLRDAVAEAIYLIGHDDGSN